MYADVFYWFLNMSIAGGLTGVIVLLLRRIPRMPSRVSYLLWLIPMLRLWFPFSIASPFSIMNLLSDFAVKSVAVQEGGSFMASNFMRQADSYFPILYKTEALAEVFRAAFFVWSAVSTAALLAMAFFYRLAKTEMKDLRLYKDNIYFSDGVTSPAVFGILPGKSKRTGLYRRRIILPRDIREADLSYILMHERLHIKRGDNVWRMLALVTACMHWFNPLVWIFLKYFFEDMELSCDAAVLRQCGEKHKKEYACVLLRFAAGQTAFSSAFGGAKTKVRIRRILSYRKLTVFSSVCFAVLIAAATVILLTNGYI